MNNLPFNMFDLIAVAFLAFGVSRGRKNGMSVEMMFMFQWLAIVFGCAFGYAPVGQFFYEESPLSRVTCNIIAYFFLGIVIRIFFGFIRRSLGGKLVGSSIFGAAEYYLGMAAGLVRFFCITIFLLAFLHARQYTAKEVRENLAYQQKWFDSNFFPSQHDLQKIVFEKSILGPRVIMPLEFLLIKPTIMEERGIRRAGDFKEP
jgi:uncharacterized membrane protein required for colicin V production